jgi:hypothetical protein
MRMMATGHGGERGSVWQVPGVMATLLAGADGEARARSTGHRGTLARSGACPCASWRPWADMGVSCVDLGKPLLGQWLA